VSGCRSCCGSPVATQRPFTIRTSSRRIPSEERPLNPAAASRRDSPSSNSRTRR
jgi:hypothetical protein